MSKPQKQLLRVIALASTKGGASKTSLSAALAVKLSGMGNKVALLDCDPQSSLARWHELRGLPSNPKLLDVDASSEALGLVRAERHDFLVIDTPPAMMEKIEAAIYIADFVVIPVRPSLIDLEAARETVKICRDFDKPFAFIITQVLDKGFVRMVKGARVYLEKLGPVFDTQISFRKAYITAMTLGKSAPETGDAVAADEINKLWDEIQKLARVTHD